MTEPRFQIGQLVSPIGYSPGVVRSLAWITASNPQQRDGYHYVVEGGATRRFMETSLRPVDMEEPVADSNDFRPMGQSAHDPNCQSPKCRIPW